MSSMLLAGLTDHEAAAVEIMIGMNWQDQRVLTIPRGLGLGVPEQTPAARACAVCVLDLFGFGLRRHSPENESRLLEFLAGRPAVLLVWGSGGGWLERKLPLARGQTVAWVCMPYSSADMLAAIKRVRAEPAGRAAAPPPRAAHDARGEPPSLRRETAPAPLTAAPVTAAPDAPPARAPAEAPVPAWRRAMALAEQLKSSAGRAPAHPAAPERPAALREPPAPQPALRASASAPHPAPAPAQPAHTAPAAPAATLSLSDGAFQAVLEVYPALASMPLVMLSQRMLAASGPQLLRLGGDAAFIAHVQQGWLASGLPISALLKLLHTPHLVERMEVAPLPVDEVEANLRQLFGGRFHRAQAPLDVIVWELMSDALKGAQLAPRGDLAFRLHRFPNFTLLQDIGPLDIQLASICARMEQSVSALLRAFPRHGAEVHRFVALCVLSGLAGVTQVSPAASGTGPGAARALAPAERPAAQTAARRGFFKSLLDKLF